MTYGTIKVDTVTFTDAGIDKSVTLSGLVQNPTFSGNVTVTGTLSGVTVTGTTANFTSGNFTNISGGTHTITSGVFAAGSAASPSITFTGDLNTGIYSPGADQVAISTGGTGRLFVDASGNVGVGTNDTANAFVTLTNQDVSLRLNPVTGSASITAVQTGVAFRDLTIGSNQTIFQTAATERLRITAAGLVGVGTSSPSKKVEIANGDVRLTDGYTISWGDDAWRIFRNGSQLRFDANGTQALTIDSSQRVGIGTTSPSAILDVKVASDAKLLVQEGNTTGNVKFNAVNNAVNANVNLEISASNTQFFNGGSERLRITSAGLVGIGTSSPAERLDVAGNIRLSGNQALIFQQSSGVATGAVSFRNSAGVQKAAVASYYNVADEGAIEFVGPTGSTNMLLSSSGRVGIGDNAPGTFDVRGAKLTLADSTSDGIGIKGRKDSLDRWYVGYNSSDHLEINQIRNNQLAFKTNNTEVARLTNSGQLLVGTSSARSNLYTGSLSAALQIEGTSYSTSSISLVGNGINSAQNPYPIFYLGRSRGTTVGSNTVLVNGDEVGAIVFTGADGTNLIPTASIESFVDTTPGANDMPGRLVFSTTADGASSPTERLRITSAGLVGVGTSSPVCNLDVFTASSATEVRIRNNTDGLRLVANTDGTQLIRSVFNYGLVFGTGTGSTNDTFREAFRVDGSQRLLVGTSSARSNFYNDTNSARFQVEGTDNDGAAIAVVQNFAANTIGAQLILAKSNLTSVGSNTLVAAGDRCGNISFQGNDGAQFVEAAAITGVIDGTPGTNDMPGRLVFSTTADGANSPTERLRITSAGNVGIGTTSPGKKLTVYGTSNNEEVIEINNTSGSADGNTTNAIRVVAGNGDYWANLRYTAFSHVWGFGGNPSVSEAARIDSSGRLLVGTSTGFGNQPLQIESAGGGLFIRRSLPNSSIGNGSGLGLVVFGNQEGNAGAMIEAVGDGSWGTNDYPGRLVFFTTADGASSLTERMRIKANGTTCIGTSTEGTMSGDTVVAIGPNIGIISKSASVAASGTVDININTGGGGYQGFLVVANTSNSNAAIRTHATFSVFGRGTDSSIQQIATDDGPTSGASFTVTTPSNGVIRVTNTTASTTNVDIQFFGGTSG